ALQAAQDSPNAAERFLAHHAGATLGLRKCHRHLLEALRAIDYADRKVLDQFVGLCGFLDCLEDATAPTIAFGRSCIDRGELPLGLEAIASAVALDIARGGLWGRRRDNAQHLASLYSEAAARVGWAGGGERGNSVPRIAYVTSSLGDDEPAARSAAAFAHAIGSRELKLGIYSTEGYVARDKQQWTHLVNEGDGALPTARRGRATLQRIESSPATHWIAPTSGSSSDVIGAAKALAQQISDDQTDLIFIDADPSDPVASLLACWPVAERCIWIARRSPLFSEQIDGICYFDPAAAEIDRGWWATRDITSTSTIEGVDLSAPVGEGPRRAQFGIPGAAVIAATSVEDVPRQVGMKMIEQVIALLKANAQLVFLLIGSGDTSVHRRKFELAGVGRRVGYAGQRRDLPAFLKMADLYLCPFAFAGAAEDGRHGLARGGRRGEHRRSPQARRGHARPHRPVRRAVHRRRQAPRQKRAKLQRRGAVDGVATARDGAEDERARHGLEQDAGRARTHRRRDAEASGSRGGRLSDLHRRTFHRRFDAPWLDRCEVKLTCDTHQPRLAEPPVGPKQCRPIQTSNVPRNTSTAGPVMKTRLLASSQRSK
ncbi:MAG: hypothetical protein AAGK78_07175, partial [Planctomycetota bacterium]